MVDQQSYEGVTLIKSDSVQELMESRHVLDEDIKKVIHHAESTREKLYQPGGSRFLGKKMLGEVTFYVEYSIEEEKGFVIHDVYWHKLRIGQ